MKNRWMLGAMVALTIIGAAASPAFASGGSGGGGGGGTATGGGGGGGGGGVVAPAPCGNLTVVAGLSSTGGPQVSGSTEKSCDGLSVDIFFADRSPAAGCTLTIPLFFGATYFKYGVHPPSRYSSPIYEQGSCAGTAHIVDARLVDRTTGAVISTASTTWTA